MVDTLFFMSELNLPYKDLMRIPDRSLQAALAHVNQ